MAQTIHYAVNNRIYSIITPDTDTILINIGINDASVNKQGKVEILFEIDLTNAVTIPTINIFSNGDTLLWAKPIPAWEKKLYQFSILNDIVAYLEVTKEDIFLQNSKMLIIGDEENGITDINLDISYLNMQISNAQNISLLLTGRPNNTEYGSTAHISIKSDVDSESDDVVGINANNMSESGKTSAVKFTRGDNHIIIYDEVNSSNINEYYVGLNGYYAYDKLSNEQKVVNTSFSYSDIIISNINNLYISTYYNKIHIFNIKIYNSNVLLAEFRPYTDGTRIGLKDIINNKIFDLSDYNAIVTNYGES